MVQDAVQNVAVWGVVDKSTVIHTGEISRRHAFYRMLLVHPNGREREQNLERTARCVFFRPKKWRQVRFASVCATQCDVNPSRGSTLFSAIDRAPGGAIDVGTDAGIVKVRVCPAPHFGENETPNVVARAGCRSRLNSRCSTPISALPCLAGRETSLTPSA